MAFMKIVGDDEKRLKELCKKECIENPTAMVKRLIALAYRKMLKGGDVD